jgi:hypothetical protein
MPYRVSDGRWHNPCEQSVYRASHFRALSSERSRDARLQRCYPSFSSLPSSVRVELVETIFLLGTRRQSSRAFRQAQRERSKKRKEEDSAWLRSAGAEDDLRDHQKCLLRNRRDQRSPLTSRVVALQVRRESWVPQRSIAEARRPALRGQWVWTDSRPYPRRDTDRDRS